MRYKLTIRRIGAVLPTICLVVLLFLCLTVVWLSTVGLPQAALRRLEAEAAKEGISLSIGALKLQPTRGLAFGAEDIRISSSPPSQEAPSPALAHIRQASVGINVTQLLTGKLKVDTLQAEGGDIQLPVSDTPGATVDVKVDSLAARVRRQGTISLTSGKLRLQGMPIHLHGNISPDAFDSGSPQDEDGPTDIDALLRQHAASIDDLYHKIKEQRWEKDELPSFDIQLNWITHPYVAALVKAPRYDWDKYHFRDIAANVLYEDGKIVINSLHFNTIDPESTVSLQAGYDTSDRTLSFSLESNAALLKMARSMVKGTGQTFLSQFYHADEHAPHIILKGDVGFEPDFSLRHATVVGNLMQEQLYIGSHCVEQLELAFYYNNGDFNINRLHLQFPKGWLTLSAAAQQGNGSAQLEANLPIAETLDLINELAGTTLALPPELQLGGNVDLKAEASLSTPLFEPGQTDWQDFVPALHHLTLDTSCPRVAFSSFQWEKPWLKMELSGLVQGHEMQPQAAEKLQLDFAADSFSRNQQGQDAIRLLSPKAGLILRHLNLAENGDASLASAQLAVSLKEALASSLQLQEAAAQVQLEQAAWKAGELIIPAAAAQVHAGQTQAEGMKVASWELILDNLKELKPWGAPAVEALPKGGRISLEARGLTHKEQSLGNLSLSAAVAEGQRGQLELSLSPEGADGAPSDAIAHLHAVHDWTQPECVLLKDVELVATPSALEDILPHFGAEIKACQLPDKLEIKGDARLGTRSGQLEQASVSLRIPELVRTPGTVRHFRGREIPVSLEADAWLASAPEGGLDYRANVKLAHQSGSFEGTVTGNSNKGLSVTGKSTIDLETLDALIDLNDAHDIMRDFRTHPQSKTTISDIAVQVDYSNGLSVDSTCNATLENMDYLMGAIEVDAAGNEHLRTDMGRNPYTAINSCSCRVTTKVRDGVRQQGQTLPPESVVYIDNALINYNNAPWFSRQDFSTVRQGLEKGRTPRSAPLQSTVTAERIIIDIEHSFVELNKVSGNVYPAYAFGMFYPDLESYMEDVLLPAPAQVETDSCVFPIYDDCTRPMSGAIRVEAPGPAGFRFLGTTIPLQRFSGFIYLTDDYVLLDRMNAMSWEGVLNAAVKIGITGKRSSFDGFASAENMDLRHIAASYGSQQNKALVNANIRFRSPSPDLSDIEAYGEGVIANGDLMSLGLFQPVGDLISDIPGHLTELESAALDKQASKPGMVSRLATRLFKSTGDTINRVGSGIDWTSQNVPGLNHILAYDLQDAYIRFNIGKGHLVTDALKAKGYNLNVHANLDINLDTMEIRGNLWPRISSLPTVILSPLTFLSDFMIDIVVYGKVDDIQWKFSLDRRLKNTPPSATAEPGDPAYQPATTRAR